MEDQLPSIIKSCINDGRFAEGRKYNEPQVMVITPDCYFAIDLHKKVEEIDFSRTGNIIKSFKLFSKHMKPKGSPIYNILFRSNGSLK